MPVSVVTPAFLISLRIPMKSDSDSDFSRTPIPTEVGQMSERSDAVGGVIVKCPE